MLVALVFTTSEASPQNNDPRAASSGVGYTAKTDAELVAEAITYGNCVFLYQYVARGKENTDAKLVTNANNAIKHYTSLDTGTSKYRNDKIEARVRRVPKYLMEQVFIEPEVALPGVVSSLVSGVSDQFLKAKTLHDWICDNIAYDAEMYFSGIRTNQDYANVLKKQKAVCSGYSSLMNQMCKLAGIESIGVRGYSKGFGYAGKIGRDTDHEWNAVHIGNKWYLVDVTWDAGPLELRTFIKRYSTAWLFLDSRLFLYSHLPKEEAYQYYAPVLTTDNFMREAYIAGKFFQYGLALKTEAPEYNNSIDGGGFTFDIVSGNTNTALSSQLRTLQQQNVNAASRLEKHGTTVTCDFDVPDTGEYKGHIFARWKNIEKPQGKIDVASFERQWLTGAEQLFADKKITENELNLFKDAYYKIDDNNAYYFAEDQFNTAMNNAVIKVHQLLEQSMTMMETVLSFNVHAASGYQGFGNGILKYPVMFSNYNQLSDTHLISPITGSLKVGSTENFVISSKDYASFAIIINGEWNFFTKNSKTGNFELNFTVPSNIKTLIISCGTAKTVMHWGLIQYNVVQ
jgi:hypothetical protein